MKDKQQHRWKYNHKKEQWGCRRCGEVITVREFIKRFGVLGNLDVDPDQGLDRIAEERKR